LDRSQFHIALCRIPESVSIAAQPQYNSRSTFVSNGPYKEPTATALRKRTLTVKPQGSHPVVLPTVEATFVLSNTTPLYLTNLNFPHICAASFSL